MLEALLSNPDSTTVLLSVGVWPSQYTLGFFLTVVKRVGAGYGFLPVLQLLQSLSAHYFMHRWVRLLPGPLGYGSGFNNSSKGALFMDRC